MICRSDIANMKTNIGEMTGKKVIVKGVLTRNKTFEKEATIQKAYPEVFTVKYEGNERDVSYSYKDLLTNTVQLEVFDGENYNRLEIPATVSAKL